MGRLSFILKYEGLDYCGCLSQILILPFQIHLRDGFLLRRGGAKGTDCLPSSSKLIQ
jgi:hypothetical protein